MYCMGIPYSCIKYINKLKERKATEQGVKEHPKKLDIQKAKGPEDGSIDLIEPIPH
jgi:hypothetical protein